MEKIIIADDHPVTLSGITQYVESLGYKVLGAYTNGLSALNNILALNPDYAIVDVSMPGMTGLEVLEKIRMHSKTIKVVLYTMYHDSALFEKAKSLGVNGFVLKDFALEELKDCLENLRHKKFWFSPRLQKELVVTDVNTQENNSTALTSAEKKIISLLAKGMTNKDIGEQLFLSEKTVENHRYNAIKKLGLVGQKNALLLWALKNADKLG